VQQPSSQQLDLDDLQNKSSSFLSYDEGEMKPIGSEMNISSGTDSGNDSGRLSSLSVAMSSFRSMESSE
jgi:hypothetical protein